MEGFISRLRERVLISDQEAARIRHSLEVKSSGFVDAVTASGAVSEQHVLEVLREKFHLKMETVLDIQGAGHDFTSRVPIQFLKKYLVVPLVKSSESRIIALNDPTDLGPAHELIQMLNLHGAEMVLAPKNEILAAINALYNKTSDSAQQLVEDMEENGSAIIQEIEKTADLLDDTSDAPVIRLVNHMISQSIKAKASDIHVEPFQDKLNVRYRIDGILYDMLSPPKWIQSALTSRIKVMADMNIAEKRVPQDGRLEVRMGEQEIDIRVSTVPTSFGERVVMRLLNKSTHLLELDEFGISPNNLAIFNRLIRLHHGMVLVTGPTGSGKTTTLYAALSAINTPDKNIITIEDPVEYNLSGIGQIQINTKIGVTFAGGLRSIVRQDPDVILVGEIRDLETAEIAIQSALTGHLVFSTLHTNDSASAVTRLTDLGVEPYLITSSVRAVVAQRLVRELCAECREPCTLTREEISSMNLTLEELKGKVVYRARGCPACFHTGYTGRQAVFEILELDEELKNLILTTSDANRIKQAALAKGMLSLRRNGIDKVLDGITTVEEVLRVTQD